MIKEKFLMTTEQYGKDHTFIYTDASKNKERVGFGICIPSIEYNFSSRLPGALSISKAESIAIHQAVEIATAKHLNKAIIFSDSLNAITNIKTCNISASADIRALKTKKLISSANENGTKILLSWIPGHSNIFGNTQADILAKIGRDLNVPMEVQLNSQDALSVIRGKITKEYQEKWKARMPSQSSEEKLHKCTKKNGNF
uniref:Ribonuclease H1-like n=1 Tax=Diabrotica virgifera virgifera TaxID=50390 RepID=A0A6P7H6W2_DIAVI